MYNSVMSRSPTEAEPNLHFRNHFQLHVIESGGAAAADGLSACAPGDSASPQPARGMNRVMNMERTVTPTRWAQRAALRWKAVGAAAPERLRRGIAPARACWAVAPCVCFREVYPLPINGQQSLLFVTQGCIGRRRGQLRCVTRHNVQTEVPHKAQNTH